MFRYGARASEKGARTQTEVDWHHPSARSRADPDNSPAARARVTGTRLSMTLPPLSPYLAVLRWKFKRSRGSPAVPCYFHPPGQRCIVRVDVLTAFVFCRMAQNGREQCVEMEMWGSHEAGLVLATSPKYGSFRKLRAPYFGVHVIRILLFRVLY